MCIMYNFFFIQKHAEDYSEENVLYCIIMKKKIETRRGLQRGKRRKMAHQESPPLAPGHMRAGSHGTRILNSQCPSIFDI
jgi:hypothetical protein